jgi:hypothetical protein
MPVHIHTVTTTCTTSTGNAVAGVVFLLAMLGAIALFATLNAQARRKLAIANAELAFLRPEVERLRGTWTVPGGAPAAAPAFPGGEPAAAPAAPAFPGGEPAAAPAAPGWHPDPTGRHEYRLWDGYTWNEDVADNGVASKDPMPR